MAPIRTKKLTRCEWYCCCCCLFVFVIRRCVWRRVYSTSIWVAARGKAMQLTLSGHGASYWVLLLVPLSRLGSKETPHGRPRHNWWLLLTCLKKTRIRIQWLCWRLWRLLNRICPTRDGSGGHWAVSTPLCNDTVQNMISMLLSTASVLKKILKYYISDSETINGDYMTTLWIITKN